MNFRRFLKHLVKSAHSHKSPNTFVTKKLLVHGLIGNVSTLCKALVMKNAKATGRHFARLGRAAIKQKKVVNVLDIANAVQEGQDLRKVPFQEMHWLYVNLRDRQLDENKRLAKALCNMTQGTCALEGQAVSQEFLDKMILDTENKLRFDPRQQDLV